VVATSSRAACPFPGSSSSSARRQGAGEPRAASRRAPARPDRPQQTKPAAPPLAPPTHPGRRGERPTNTKTKTNPAQAQQQPPGTPPRQTGRPRAAAAAGGVSSERERERSERQRIEVGFSPFLLPLFLALPRPRHPATRLRFDPRGTCVPFFYPPPPIPIICPECQRSAGHSILCFLATRIRSPLPRPFPSPQPHQRQHVHALSMRSGSTCGRLGAPRGEEG
jgi:hypothetical protein